MRLLLIIVFLISSLAFSQDDILAKEYFKRGEFEKALSSFQRLHDANPGNINYLLQLVKTHQQLEQYDTAETLILKQLERINYPSLYVELGYNYQLKDNITNANINYNKALESLNLNARYVFSVAQSFVSHSLLDEAITAYEKAMTLAPDLNFDMQLAQIYGEQGDIEKMFTAYVQFVKFNPSYFCQKNRCFSACHFFLHKSKFRFEF